MDNCCKLCYWKLSPFFPGGEEGFLHSTAVRATGFGSTGHCSTVSAKGFLVDISLLALLLETLSVFPRWRKGASVLCSQGPLDVARAVLVEWPPGGPRFLSSVTGNSLRFSRVVSEGFLDLSLVGTTPGGATSFIPHYWKLSSFFCGTVFEAGYQ